ncbi:MAG: putative rane protein [Gemmatimonadetes bacterium]|jgi:putative membrane protein|nr:putative rane protein [Gemmatimonadota bacterium]
MGLTRHDGGTSRARVANVALVGHAVLLVFSGIAFATFLAPPFPAWLVTPANQRIASFMFTFGGQTTVVLGAIAGVVHAASRLGWRTTLWIFASSFALSLGAELAGTTTGYPFGPYSYTTQLGYLIGGRVPFNIPTSWFFMLYASLAICGRFMSPLGATAKWRWAAVAALVLTAWDVSMDPAMVATTHWLWKLPSPEGASLLRRVALSDLFYGMPLTNWLGWLLTGFVVARVMLAIVPPARWAAEVSPSRLPLVLYAVNGVLPVLICVGRGMWWAVLFGSVAMLVPLGLAVRAGAGRRMRRGLDRSGAGGAGGPPDNKFVLAWRSASPRHRAAKHSTNALPAAPDTIRP